MRGTVVTAIPANSLMELRSQCPPRAIPMSSSKMASRNPPCRINHLPQMYTATYTPNCDAAASLPGRGFESRLNQGCDVRQGPLQRPVRRIGPWRTSCLPGLQGLRLNVYSSASSSQIVWAGVITTAPIDDSF